MNRILKSTLVVVIIFAMMPRLAAAQQPASEAAFRDIDPFIESVIKEWKVPGLAIAVIQDGKVILSKGYGYRDVEKGLPVTPRTLFAIGSISKSFTATVLGMLSDEGKLDWDKPVRAYMPDFQLHDAAATAQMTARDLVIHDSGLPRHDALWYGSSLTRRQLYERIRYLEPSKSFRSTFQYNNLMFMTAGLLAGQIAGTSWEQLVRHRLFEPLGMLRSGFSINDSQKSDDFALTYSSAKNKIARIPFRNIDEVGPAGSINSSVEEMIRYVQLHIDKGRYGEAQLLSARNAEQMQTPQLVTPGTIEYEELGHRSYGLGLGISSYRGNKTVEHGGGIDGFSAYLAFMPRKRAGLIILTNCTEGGTAVSIITRNVYDRLLGLDQIDWSSRARKQTEKAKQAAEEARKKNATPRKEGTSLSHPLSDFAGDYNHPAYGRLKIEVEGSGLKGTFNQMAFSMKHFHYDIFEVPEDGEGSLVFLQNSKIAFFYNKKGEIDRVAIPLEAAVSDIVFTRASK